MKQEVNKMKGWRLVVFGMFVFVLGISCALVLINDKIIPCP